MPAANKQDSEKMAQPSDESEFYTYLFFLKKKKPAIFYILQVFILSRISF